MRKHKKIYFFFSSRRRHTRSKRDWSSDVCSSDLNVLKPISITVEDLKLPPIIMLKSTTTLGEVTVSGKKPFIELGMGKILVNVDQRSEERRVGKECRCGWSADGR